ncbi:MAG: hypothetical protein AAGU04_08155 [Anaerolineaceae bacterium]
MTENEKQNTINVPQEEIVLRCNRCNKPITPETAVLTPTGYRCKECIRSQQKIFDTTKGLDVPLGLLISALIAFGGSWLAGRIGFLILLVAPGVGTLIANVVRWTVRKRRSKALGKAVLWGSILGCLPLVLLRLLPLLGANGGQAVLGGLLPLVWQAVYALLLVSSAYYQSTGIKLN